MAIAILLVMTCVNVMPAEAKQATTVRLDAAVDKPVMLAGEKQTAYIRIGLEGLSLEIKQQRMPVNIALVIDKSGSMGGKKIEQAKQAAITAINKLNCNDIVSVITYDSKINVIMAATKLSDKQDVIAKIRAIQAGQAIPPGILQQIQTLPDVLSADLVYAYSEQGFTNRPDAVPPDLIED